MTDAASSPDQAGDDLAFFIDLEPQDSDMMAEVVEGLSATPKGLSPKYFYDQRGSELFDRITMVPEYYVGRTEIALLRQIGAELAADIGPDATVIEYGSGASVKIRTLLDALEKPHLYAGVDISRNFLLESCRALKADYPDLPIGAICADFTRPFEIPAKLFGDHWRLAFFPGSTIGNFTPDQAVEVLKAIRSELRPDDSLLIGVDLKKDRDVLERAYDDSQGVTAAFNLNVLHVINRVLEADIPVENFSHRAVYNEDKGRVEMHLVAEEAVSFTIGGHDFSLEKGETIHTENSHKYSEEEFNALAARAGFKPHRIWIDDNRLFSVRLMRAV